MEAEARLDALRSAAQLSLASHDSLLDAWRALEVTDVRHLIDSNDIELLKQLIVRRIYPINAFSMLAAVSKETAIEMLLSRYLGVHVEPDNKFGGYEFELSSMLDDLREHHGEAALRQLIADPTFKKSRLEDRRVVRSFSETLAITERQFPEWLSLK